MGKRRHGTYIFRLGRREYIHTSGTLTLNYRSQIFVDIPSGVSETWYKAFPIVVSSDVERKVFIISHVRQNTILTLIAVIFIAIEAPVSLSSD